MSYTMNIEPAEFKNIRTGDVTTGVLVRDNYVSLYIMNDIIDVIPDDDIKLIEKIIEYMMEYSHLDTDHLWNMFHNLKEGGYLSIGYQEYHYEDIEHLLRDLPDEKPIYGWMAELVHELKQLEEIQGQ